MKVYIFFFYMNEAMVFAKSLSHCFKIKVLNFLSCCSNM